MSVQTINPTTVKAGCCPHGLPQGACPVCSGMGSGSTKMAEPVQKKSDEWSYEKCYSVWQRMLAKDAQAEANKQAEVSFRAMISSFQKNIQTIVEKTNALTNFLETNLPKPLAKTVNIVSQKILIPILKIIQNLPNNVQKTIANIQRFLADISDKLTAIFGELKNSIEKRLQKTLKSVKKGILTLFAIFNINMNNEEDDEKINETKRIYKLKVMKEQLLKMNSKEEKDARNTPIS